MSGSKDLEGVHGAIKVLDLECASPGCCIGQISAEQWGAATEDEVATRVQGVFPLHMGREREDRCE